MAAEINFEDFDLLGKSVLIEFPTQSNFGLILTHGENSTAQSGWFKVVKKGLDVGKDIIEGCEAYVYFHHQPYEFDEVILQSRKIQKEKVLKSESKETLILPEGPFSTIKADVPRLFGIVKEHDILMVRKFTDE